MATQCEVKQEMVRVVSVPMDLSLSHRVQVIREAAKRSSSSPPAIRNDTGTPPPDDTRRKLLTVEPPQGESDSATPQLDSTILEPSVAAQGDTEPCSTEHDSDLPEGITRNVAQKVDTEIGLSSRHSSFLTISTVSDEPSDSDVEKKRVKKIR